VTSPWIHSGLAERKPWFYVVTSVTAKGESAPSAEVTSWPFVLLGGAIQGPPLGLAGTASTFAGPPGGAESIDGTGAAAAFDVPYGAASDGTNLFVSDRNCIRKVVLATGAVTTLAGSSMAEGTADETGAKARFKRPAGLAYDGGNLYVADSGNCAIRRVVVATRAVSTIVAGPCNSSSTLDHPLGVATDGTSLFVADTGHDLIVKVTLSTGEAATLAGSGTGGKANGTGTAASFFEPAGLALLGGSLYVAERGNSTVRAIDLGNAAVTTLAGTAGARGSTDAAGTEARFCYPEGLATDGADLLVADTGYHTVRRIVVAGAQVSTLAGTADAPGWADGTGPAARFHGPVGIAAADGAVHVLDRDGFLLRRLDPSTGAVTTTAGIRGGAGSADGAAGLAAFAGPRSVTTDGVNLYVSDTDACVVRRVALGTGEVTTIAGLAYACSVVDATGAAARFKTPRAITTDGASLFVADTSAYVIRQVDLATLAVTTLAGTANTPGNADGAPGTATFIGGLTTDGTSLFASDAGNNSIRQVDPRTGEVTTLAGGASGYVDGTLAEARFSSPRAITTDGAALYVADFSNSAVRRIDLGGGTVETVAGTGSCGYGGPALCLPTGLTTDGASLYVTEAAQTLAAVELATGTILRLSGAGEVPGFANGTGTDARFRFIDGVAITDGGGITSDGTALYVADTANHKVRRVE
jgi:sugar lactone lactonase YvrE